ncbi:MAG: hypothetical protein R3E89_19360 [Thiolinea sp.]
MFNVVAGYERPMFFGKGEVRGETPTWGHSEAFPAGERRMSGGDESGRGVD